MAGPTFFEQHGLGETCPGHGTRGRFCMNRAQLAPPCVDQRGRDIVTSAHVGDAGPRRKCLRQDLQPLFVTPPTPPFRPCKYRDLTHPPLLSALTRARLRPLVHLPDKAGPAGWVRFFWCAKTCSTLARIAKFAASASAVLGHRHALGLFAMDAAFEHVVLQPCFILAHAKGAIAFNMP